MYRAATCASQDGDLACGNKRLIRLAARFECVAACKWLVQHGATLDVVALWKMGLYDVVRDALAATPSAAQQLDAASGASPVHEAAAAGDTELLLVLMEAVSPAVLGDLKDATFHATPLQWAQFNGQPGAVAAIEARLESALASSGSTGSSNSPAGTSPSAEGDT